MAIASSVGPLHAQERFHRLFNADDGLNPPSVRSLTQDRAGFLWIGTEGGLVRYDGVEVRRWSPSSLNRAITRVVASPDGPVVALRQGTLFTITSTGAERISGPEGQPIVKARDMAFDATGALWIIRGDEVWRRDLGGRWTRTSIPLAEGERPLLVREHVRDTIHLVTNYGLWRLAPAKSAAPILPSLEDLLGYDEVFVDVHTTGDGRVLALTFLGRVLELTEAGPRELFRTDRIGAGGRAIGIVDRAGTIWVSVDRYLIGWRSGKSPVVLGRDESIESGGPLLVDHEGSLWMGSFVGLYQFAEPETQYWTERQGLPSSHTRYLARTGDTVWITTWYGAGYLRQGPGGWEIGGVSGWMPSRLFVDSRGALWAGTEHGLIEMRDGHAASRHLAGPVGLYALHETAEGTIWLATSAGLLLREPRKASLRNVPVPELSGKPPPVESVLVDGQGDLWVSSGETVCRARAGLLRASAEAEWACESIPGAVHVSGGGLVEMPSGALWLSTNRLGVLRRVGDRWEPVPGVQTLPSRSILSLVPSRSEGIWIVGHGALHRVTETVGDSLGWRVEEHLTAWHGLPVTSGTHLLEDSDGGLWVTTTLGVSYVPAAARFATLDLPRVALVDARVDDQPVSLGSALELAHDRNRLELRFAALSFRDPSLIRYQVRLSPDDPWVDTAGTPFFRWVDLPAGRYEAQVRASLDGERWSMAPANFSFHVAPPWYWEWWAVTLFLTLGVVAVYAAHRLRVGHLLDLERQRTRIAMDLHDEIGSGLGSIGILSGILTANGLEPPDERRMAREISATAGQLGTALSQIVWTLDPKVRTMEEVAGRLAELGRRLFPDDRTEFTTRFPDRWHEARPSQFVRRNVVLIGLEALHNAARHAHANRVELHVYHAENGWWELDVIDDGVGLPGDRGTSGVGLRSMRRRAEEIGAQLTWSSPNGKGTKVRLIFQPRGSSRRKFGGFWHAARSFGGS